MPYRTGHDKLCLLPSRVQVLPGDSEEHLNSVIHIGVAEGSPRCKSVRVPHCPSIISHVIEIELGQGRANLICDGHDGFKWHQGSNFPSPAALIALAHAGGSLARWLARLPGSCQPVAYVTGVRRRGGGHISTDEISVDQRFARALDRRCTVDPGDTALCA